MQLINTNIDSSQQQQELTEKTRRRRRLLKKIIRNNRQNASDKEFDVLINLDKELFAGYNAYRLGNFCIQENRLDLAEENLLKAKQLIGRKFLFTNLYVSLGNLEVKRKNTQKATIYYQTVLSESPHKNSKTYFNKDQMIFAGKLNSFNAYSDAHDHLMKIYVENNQLEKGYSVCQAASLLKQEEQSAIMNFAGVVEELLGDRKMGLGYAWGRLVEETRQKGSGEWLEGFERVDVKEWVQQQQGQELKTQTKKVNVFSVKWGSKYSSEHVNKLYASINRNTTWQVFFHCLTDDPYGINKNIITKPLNDQWKKQWGKALLFKENEEIKGKKCYIDLDTVITGNLDSLFEYNGEFATLKSTSKKEGKYLHIGYASTVMIWQGNGLKCVYEMLEKNFEVIEKLLLKFDYWLDLVVENADDLEKLYPEKIVNFQLQFKDSMPQSCSIVHFPKRPKPQDYPAEWVRKHWTE